MLWQKKVSKDAPIERGKKVQFLKSEKIGKKKVENAAAYDTERPLYIQSDSPCVPLITMPDQTR